MSISKFVPLVPFMTEVAGIHIDTWNSLQTSLQYYFKLFEKISDHIYVSICVSATYAISGTS